LVNVTLAIRHRGRRSEEPPRPGSFFVDKVVFKTGRSVGIGCYITLPKCKDSEYCFH